MFDFYDEAYHHPIEMFSWEHFVALGVFIAIVLIVFFSRKFFMKNAIADIVFRYSLVFVLLFFELVPYYHNGSRSLLSVIIQQYPLCGQLVWLCTIAILANSARLAKLLYPLAMLGATMSLLIIDMDCTFPHIRAFQFFFTHGCFMLGMLYFVFTKKITKYTLKDLRNSCALLFGLSCYALIIASTKKSVNAPGDFFDSYFILSPPNELMAIKDALGQIGYTIVFLICVVIAMFAIYGITYLCTRKRKDEEVNIPKYKDCKMLNYINKYSPKQRYSLIAILFGIGIYVFTLQKFTSYKALLWIDNIIFFALLIMIIINEIAIQYKKYHDNDNIENMETKTEPDEKIAKKQN